MGNNNSGNQNDQRVATQQAAGSQESGQPQVPLKAASPEKMQGGPMDHMLQTPEEVAARSDRQSKAIDTRPIRAGHYRVAEHTSVRSLDHTFKPGEPFEGAAGDVAGLLKSGALVEHDDD